jgi:hypothetical protein
MSHVRDRLSHVCRGNLPGAPCGSGTSGLAPDSRLHLIGETRERVEARRSRPARDGGSDQRDGDDDRAARGRARRPPGARSAKTDGFG